MPALTAQSEAQNRIMAHGIIYNHSIAIQLNRYKLSCKEPRKIARL